MGERLTSMLDDMQKNIRSLEVEVLTEKKQKATIEEQIEKIQNKIANMKKQLNIYEKATMFLQQFSQKRRREGQRIFSNMGTLALQNIYGDGFRVEMEYSVKRGRPVADIFIVSPYADAKDHEVKYSSEYAAGGENDVISFAMKLALLQAYKPKQEGPIILDETFKHLSVDHIDDVAEMLSQISSQLERQFIFCTSHRHPSFSRCADKVFNIQRENDGASVVLEEQNVYIDKNSDKEEAVE